MKTTAQPIIDAEGIHWYTILAYDTLTIWVSRERQSHRLYDLVIRWLSFAERRSDRRHGRNRPIAHFRWEPSSQCRGVRDSSIGVELLWGNGQIQLGFSIDNCVSLTGDHIWYSSWWE